MKTKPTEDGFTFDSREELEFYWWLKEAVEYKLIDFFLYHTDTFTLFDGIKGIKGLKGGMRGHVYTPDFTIQTSRGSILLKSRILTPIWRGPLKEIETYDSLPHVHLQLYSYIDVKGEWGGQYGAAREFALNQKWVFEEYGIYVQKIIPKKLFAKTWVPKKATFTEKTGKPSIKYKGCRSIKKYLEEVTKGD
jgi:hypothetical protein